MPFRSANWLLILASLMLAGCESLSDATTGVRERWGARAEPHVKTVPGAPRDVYNAVKVAATNMGYRQLRGGPAQGEFDAITKIGAGERSGSSRQIAMKVRLRETLDGGRTEVSVWLTEIIEDDSSRRMGMATETALQGTAQYDAFFRQVDQALGGRTSASD